MAYQGNMIVLGMLEKFTIPFISILGIIFFVPLQEIESSGFRIESLKAAYFTRYSLMAPFAIVLLHYFISSNSVSSHSLSTYSLYLTLLGQILRRAVPHFKGTGISIETLRVHFAVESSLTLQCNQGFTDS